MLVAALQFDIIWEDKAANHQVIETMLDEVDLPPGSFLLLPELTDTGFSFNLDRIVDDQTLIWARDCARRRGMYLQVGYATRDEGDRGRNNTSIITPTGEILTTYQKIHPFSYGRESEYYTGGDDIVVQTTTDGDDDTMTIAPLICYDLRFPEVFRHATLQGAEVFTIGANWPAARQHHWRTLLIARAIENQAYVVACNRVGNDPHLAYTGGSIIIDPMGEVLAEGDDQPGLIAAHIDLAGLQAWRAEFPALADIKPRFLHGR